MTMSMFPEPEGIQVGVDQEGYTRVTRADLPSYEAYLDGVEKQGPGFEARLPVPTGDPIYDKKTGLPIGRGKTESKHERNFRAVAKMREIGLRVIPEDLGNGETLLRILITKRREFTPLASARRDRGRLNYQAEQAAKKANRAKQIGSKETPELEAKALRLINEVKELEKLVAKLEKEQEEQETPVETPAEKPPTPKAPAVGK